MQHHTNLLEVRQNEVPLFTTLKALRMLKVFFVTRQSSKYYLHTLICYSVKIENVY